MYASKHFRALPRLERNILLSMLHDLRRDLGTKASPYQGLLIGLLRSLEDDHHARMEEPAPESAVNVVVERTEPVSNRRMKRRRVVVDRRE